MKKERNCLALDSQMPNAKCQTQKGITLIALVITVIVLLILAGTAITMALNGNNIFEKSNTAVERANAKAEEQKTNITQVDATFNTWYDQYNQNPAPGDSNPTPTPVLPSGWSTTAVASAYTDGTEDTRQAPIPKGFKASIYEEETTIAGGLVIYETNELTADETGTTNHDYAMEHYNQYVWIPVENASSASIWTAATVTADTITLSDGNGSYVDETKEPTTLGEDFTAMKESVAKYGGFYISRYELGGTVSSTTSRKGQVVLTADSSSANQWYGLYNAAHKDITYGNNTVLKGHMMFGSEYEKVLAFINTNNTNYSTTYHREKQETIAHNSGIVTQEDKELDIVNNIVDMEGNMLECTVQQYTSTDRAGRGGNFRNANRGVYKSVVSSGDVAPTSAYDSYGVRQALYVVL